MPNLENLRLFILLSQLPEPPLSSPPSFSKIDAPALRDIASVDFEGIDARRAEVEALGPGKAVFVRVRLRRWR